MGKYQSTFQRIEKKYLLEEKQYMELRQLLEGYMKADSFAKTTVCNIYFDTPDSRLIRASLEKPVYKEKLRLRSYGTPEMGSPAFIELKKKLDGVVYKRRIDLDYEEAWAYLCREQRPTGKNRDQEQILREIDWVMNFYKELQPAMYLSYDRTALCGGQDKGLRVTFDTGILYRKEELSLSAGAWGQELLKSGQRLMEIKIPGSMPLWLSRGLSELEIYPASFSKYGKAYQSGLGPEKNQREQGVSPKNDQENVRKGGKICA